MTVSIVIPCYYSENSISGVVDKIIDVFKNNSEYSADIILVNDGSVDGTYDRIIELGRKYPNVRGINLARNFGQHNALMAALNYAEGEIVIGMDDDMQTDPSQIPLFIEKINEGYDIVYGKYPEKKHSKFRNWGSRFNDFTVRLLIGKPKGLKACSFWAAKKFVIKEIIKYHGADVHLQGLFLRTTKNIVNIDIIHHKRVYGKSNYTLKKLIRLWSGFLNFSVLPLRLSLILGGLFSGAGFIGGIIVLIRKLIYSGVATGWPSLMCVVLFGFGIVMLMLGIQGEYMGRVLLCLNSTPQFIIRDSINLIPEKKNEE